MHLRKSTREQRRWATAAWVTLLAFGLVGPASAQVKPAAETPWKVGLAQVKITPEHPLPMSGYGGRTKPFEKVAGELYAKAMVLEDASGHRGVIVTSDLLGLPAEIAEPLCGRIEKQTGLKREQILLNSSHTHAGPALSLKPPAKGEPGGEAFRTVEYTRQLQDRIVDVVVQALGRLEPARLTWGGGVIDFAMNRREFTPKGVILGVNPRGLTDRGVPVLRVDGADGKPRAILCGAAVHGTTLGPDNYQLCGDFAGFAQRTCKNSSPACRRCSSSAAPATPIRTRGTMELTRKHGKALADEVSRVATGKLRPVRGPLRIAFDRANLPLQPAPARAELEKVAADKRSLRWRGRLLRSASRGGPGQGGASACQECGTLSQE